MLHVLFQVGDAEYVVPASQVVQMETFGGATRVPGTPEYVAGLVQLRGRVVPVVDLRNRFGFPPHDRTLDARVIVVAEGDRHVGLLADRAREVVNIPPEQFQAPPQLVSERASGFVRSIAQREKRVFMLVDVEKVIGRDPLPREEHHGEES
jgi:purine-binding chemotaxis protein CheW